MVFENVMDKSPPESVSYAYLLNSTQANHPVIQINKKYVFVVLFVLKLEKNNSKKRWENPFKFT